MVRIYKVEITDNNIALFPECEKEGIVLTYSNYGLRDVNRHIIFLKLTLVCAIFSLMPGYYLRAAHVEFDKEWSPQTFHFPADFVAACKRSYYYYASQVVPEGHSPNEEYSYFTYGLLLHNYYEIRFHEPYEDQWNYFVLLQKKEPSDREVTTPDLSSWF